MFRFKIQISCSTPHGHWTTSGRGTALANSKVLPKVGWDQGGKNKWPCLSSGSLFLKGHARDIENRASHFTITILRLIFSVPSTSLQSQISGLEMRIAFGKMSVDPLIFNCLDLLIGFVKMPVDPLNHNFQLLCIC